MRRTCKVRSLVCAQCGKLRTIRDTPSTRPQRFCSQSCGKKASGTPRKGEFVSCAQCGTQVWRKPNEIKNRPLHFCTRACHRIWERRTKVAVTCRVCAAVVLKSPKYIERNAKYCSIACRDRDPEQSARLRQMNADQMLGKRTSIERIGYDMLDTLGIAYEPQYLINQRFCVDAFVPSLSLAIEFDGDYWHGHPDKFPILDQRQRACVLKDRRAARYLSKCGITLIRFWENDIKGRPEWVKSQLREVIGHDSPGTVDGL